MTQRRNRNQQTPQSTKKRAIIGVISLILIALLFVQLTNPAMLGADVGLPDFGLDVKSISTSSGDMKESYKNEDLLLGGIGDTYSDESSSELEGPYLAIFTVPSKSTITLDAKEAGITIEDEWMMIPAELDKEYEITASKDGYDSFTQKITINESTKDLIGKVIFKLAAQTVSADAQASSDTPASSASVSAGNDATNTMKKTKITINTNVKANIYIGKAQVAQDMTSYITYRLPGETYSIRATADGYIEATKTIDLTSKEEIVTLKLNLINPTSSAEEPTGTDTTITPDDVVTSTSTSQPKADFTVESVTWSKSGSDYKEPYLVTTASSYVNVWAQLKVTKTGLIKSKSFGMIVKKDISGGDDNYNPTSQKFFDLGYREDGTEISNSMIIYTGGDFTASSTGTYTIKVGQFKTEDTPTNVAVTDPDNIAKEYYAKGYTDLDLNGDWDKKYDPTGTNNRRRVTTYLKDVTPSGNDKASFRIDHIAFRIEGTSTKYQNINNAKVGDTIIMYAYLVPLLAGNVDNYDFAVKAKMDDRINKDSRYIVTGEKWETEYNQISSRGMQVYTGGTFKLTGTKYVKIGEFKPKRTTSGGYTGIKEYYAKGFVKRLGEYRHSYDPTNDGTRNRVLVPE